MALTGGEGSEAGLAAATNFLRVVYERPWSRLGTTFDLSCRKLSGLLSEEEAKDRGNALVAAEEIEIEQQQQQQQQAITSNGRGKQQRPSTEVMEITERAQKRRRTTTRKSRRHQRVRRMVGRSAISRRRVNSGPPNTHRRRRLQHRPTRRMGSLV